MGAKDKLMDSLIKNAKSLTKKPKIVLCEGWDGRGLKAADVLVKEGIADMILLGFPDDIKAEADEHKVDISNMEIIDPLKSELVDELANILVDLREKKGMTLPKAKELLKDNNYFGCMLAHTNRADAVVGSLICPTAELMRPALQILKKDFVNEIMVAYDPKRDKIFLMTDASMNIEPSSEQLAQMGVNAANVAKVFDVEPKVGFMSFSTYGSGGDVPQVDHVKTAVEIAQDKAPELEFDGEFQFDAAVDPDAAKKKCPDSKLGGQVNVFVFPDLNSANIFAHGSMQFSELDFILSVIEGLKKPVSILGRSTPEELVKNMFLVTAVQTG